MNVKRKIFEFVIDNQNRWNSTPTREELRRGFSGLSDDVDLHLEQLEREGLLILGPNGEDTVAISPTFHMPPQLKVRTGPLGGTACSQETGSVGSITLDVRGVGIPMGPSMYALRVHDQSMADAGIQQGDIAILQHACPQRGDIVAVELDGQNVLRRYVIIAGVPHLLAENPLRPDLHFAHDVPMHGVLWGSIRTEPCRWVPDSAQRKPVSYSDAGFGDRQPKHRSRRQGSSPTKDRLNRKGSTNVEAVKRRRTKFGIGASPADWPKAPSGIELNDFASLEYRSNAQPPDDNECRYGWELEQAIKDYENREKGFRRKPVGK